MTNSRHPLFFSWSRFLLFLNFCFLVLVLFFFFNVSSCAIKDIDRNIDTRYVVVVVYYSWVWYGLLFVFFDVDDDDI